LRSKGDYLQTPALPENFKSPSYQVAFKRVIYLL